MGVNKRGMKNKTHKTRVASFLFSEEGAITVDWIVLTATIIALGMAATFYALSNVPGIAENTADYMETYDIGG